MTATVARSVGNGHPRAGLDAAPERPDSRADVEDRFGVLEQVEIQGLPRDGGKVEGEVDRHQRVDEQLARDGPIGELRVPELAFDGRGDAAVDGRPALQNRRRRLSLAT